MDLLPLKVEIHRKKDFEIFYEFSTFFLQRQKKVKRDNAMSMSLFSYKCYSVLDFIFIDSQVERQKEAFQNKT